MASRGKKKYFEQWHAFAEYLLDAGRPDTFEEAYSAVCDKVSGLYESEAMAMWDNLRAINPKTIVEIGRNLGGSQFLFCCAAQECHRLLSIDIEDFELTDWRLREWGERNGVHIQNAVYDSTKWQADGVWDFVFIDGGHTGEIVRADIEIWKDHARYIAFHDYADRGTANKHKRVFSDVVAEISAAARAYQWQQYGSRGRSDITFKTGVE